MKIQYKYTIRPHHGVCFAFFKGKGYDNDFAENMSKILTDLKKNNPLVLISASKDAVCDKCPNDFRGICKTEAKVARYDEKVLRFCGIKNGTVLRYSDFEKTVFEKILAENKRQEICPDCEWSDICK